MAETKDVITSSGSSWSPEFTQDLLPAAQQTALLYHLSYLCLGNFPKLESLIRERAVETQMLFGSSEAVLLKCIGTSHNLVSSLFPILIKAVEKNKPTMAVRYLEKARAWIDDIIRAVDDIVKRYEQQNQSVRKCTSDVIQEKNETVKKITEKTDEMRKLQEAVTQLEKDLSKYNTNKEEIEKKIEEKVIELQNHVIDACRRHVILSILANLLPIVELIKYIYFVDPDATNKIKALISELSCFCSEKSRLQTEAWKIQVKLTDLQLKVANFQIQLDEIPSPLHLNNVQTCLTQIQKIMIELQKFWEKVGTMLDALKDKTFVGEDLIEDLDDMKDEFLTSIEAASKYWQMFGEGCQRASSIFSVESKDAYKFLETDPSTLSKNEWENQYRSVMEKLNQINPQGSSKAAIKN